MDRVVAVEGRGGGLVGRTLVDDDDVRPAERLNPGLDRRPLFAAVGDRDEYFGLGGRGGEVGQEGGDGCRDAGVTGGQRRIVAAEPHERERGGGGKGARRESRGAREILVPGVVRRGRGVVDLRDIPETVARGPALAGPADVPELRAAGGPDQVREREGGIVVGVRE